MAKQQGLALDSGEMERKREESERKLPWGFCAGVFVLELFTWLQLKGVYMAEISPSKIISFVSLKLGVMMVIS